METEDNTTTNNDTKDVANSNNVSKDSGENPNQKKEMTLEDYRKALAEARSEAAKYRVEKNELKKDAEAWREKIENEKSDLEKAQTKIAEAEKELHKAQLKASVLEVATSYGITSENIPLLGNNLEELEENAKRIQALQGSSNKPPQKTPEENLRSGTGFEEKEVTQIPSGWVVDGPYAQK